jgi:hypothetical protein
MSDEAPQMITWFYAAAMLQKIFRCTPIATIRLTFYTQQKVM